MLRERDQSKTPFLVRNVFVRTLLRIQFSQQIVVRNLRFFKEIINKHVFKY